jgi:putative ATP-binding cassette transporter
VFREFFYYDILPALKSKGKLVLAISHDDRYYGLGDRLIKLTYGQVERDASPLQEEGELWRAAGRTS